MPLKSRPASMYFQDIVPGGGIQPGTVLAADAVGIMPGPLGRQAQQIAAFRIHLIHDLGQLIYFFEIGCGISGNVLGVNPFNQPGVEAYKKNMFALLDKPGYEAESKAIKVRLESEE